MVQLRHICRDHIVVCLILFEAFCIVIIIIVVIILVFKMFDDHVLRLHLRLLALPLISPLTFSSTWSCSSSSSATFPSTSSLLGAQCSVLDSENRRDSTSQAGQASVSQNAEERSKVGEVA